MRMYVGDKTKCYPQDTDTAPSGEIGGIERRMDERRHQVMAADNSVAP